MMRQHSCASLKLAFSKAFLTSLHASLALLWTQDSSVNMVTKSEELFFYFQDGKRFFSSPRYTNYFCGLSILLHSHLVLRFIIRRDVPSFPDMPSWCVYRNKFPLHCLSHSFIANIQLFLQSHSLQTTKCLI
jgi:hypothetical protein